MVRIKLKKDLKKDQFCPMSRIGFLGTDSIERDILWYLLTHLHEGDGFFRLSDLFTTQCSHKIRVI